MPRHTERHPLAGQTVRLCQPSTLPGTSAAPVVDGAEYVIEDWWDHLTGKSWGASDGNPAAMMYALRGFRGGLGSKSLPLDDEVVYGKIGRFGHLVHVSELGEVLSNVP